MYKVKIPESNKAGYQWTKIHIMKVWCKETYGAAKVDNKYIWRSRMEYNVDWGRNTVDKIACFYFQKEEHATWFSIRWS